MFASLRCRLKGHLFVDSKSMPGTRVCVRCRRRLPFEGLSQTPSEGGSPDEKL
jgi:hypothetical protein